VGQTESNCDSAPEVFSGFLLTLAVATSSTTPQDRETGVYCLSFFEIKRNEYEYTTNQSV
jgi:hypothetical protein